MLTDDQLMRYSRQILLSAVDVDGQEILCGARVLVVGAGGLGCPVGLYLAGAGVGKLTVVDSDVIELSNLHRQIAYCEDDVGKSKAEVLAAAMQSINTDIEVTFLVARVDSVWLERHCSQVDLVVDCTDNFAVRTAINKACLVAGIPLVSGAAIRQQGQIAVYDFRRTGCGCYACLYGTGTEENDLCIQSGVLGPVTGIVGSMQALLAIKVLCGEDVSGRLHLFDGESMQWRSLKFARDPDCPLCGTGKQGPQALV